MKRPFNTKNTTASSTTGASISPAQLAHVRGGATIRFFTGCIGCDCNCNTCKKKANMLSAGS